jgi:hypothetical protein
MSSSYKPAARLTSRPSLDLAPLRPDPPMLVKSGSETSTSSSITYLSDESDLEKPGVKFEQPTLSGVSRPPPHVSTLARRIHGWSWQAVRLVRPGALVAIVLSLLIVPHRHGHGGCLRHSVRPERTPRTSHQDRDRFFLYKRFALYPQLIDPPASSVTCGLLSSGHFTV